MCNFKNANQFQNAEMLSEFNFLTIPIYTKAIPKQYQSLPRPYVNCRAVVFGWNEVWRSQVKWCCIIN
jgi:hypothetical protein